MLTITAGTEAKTPEPPGLFQTLPGKSANRLPTQAIEGRSRTVKINHGQLRSGRLFLSLPGGVSLEAVRDLQQEMGGRRFSWVGRANDDPASRIVIGVSRNAVAGTFAYRGKLFKLEPRANGSHVLSEVLASDPAPALDPIPVSDTDPAATAALDSAAAIAADSGTVIDVLVAYTPRVQSKYGQQGADALVIQAIAEANLAYANSGIVPRLSLVHTTLTQYTESGSMSTDLSRLRSTSDGYMDELHALRDDVGADMVSLILDDSRSCGLAYRMASLSAGFASNAFSVVHHDCATGYYSFAHELGHNQGAHHDPDNASSAIYPYAYGYQDPFGSFRTVMAFNCSGGCKRVDHFSNPDILLNGQPTGVDGLSDNARTINSTAATIAAFRQQAAQSPPSEPSGLAAEAASYSTVNLQWSDNSQDESGFHLERSGDGLDFVQIVSLPTNTTGYVDDNLLADTLYYYRVRAWNSSGNSAYSDIAIVTTETAPPVIDQLAASDLPATGSVSGTYRDTWRDDGTEQTIQETLSGGNKNSRYGHLEHKWRFQVNPGNTVELFADARTTATSDSFTFAYSTDDSNYIGMFTIDASSSGTQQFRLPPSLSGTVYVRVRDNVQTAGDGSSHSVLVDHLLIRSESDAAPPPPPAAPSGLSAAALGTDAIRLNWVDNADNESGFAIFRRLVGSAQWAQVGTTGGNATSHDDTALQPGTLYEYRITAFNDSGASAYSNRVSAQTAEEPPSWLKSKGSPDRPEPL